MELYVGLGHNNKFLNMISRLATFDERSDIMDIFYDLTLRLHNVLLKIVFSFCLTGII